MAQRLPDSLPMNAPRGVRPPAPEDQRALRAGLNTALEGAGAIFAKKADDDAVDALTEFQTGWQAQAAERAAAYDGSRPGFAAEEAARFEQDLSAFEKTRVGRSARGAFRQRADEAKAGYVGRAIAIEGQARAGVVAERREALDRQDLTRAQIALQGALPKVTAPLYDDGDVADDAFVPNIMAARAKVIEQVRETVPERLRPRWDAAMAAGDVEENAKATAFREERQEAKLFANTKDIFQLASNQLLDNPDLYDASRALVLGSLDGLPDDAAEKARPALENDLAVAYFQGLAAQDRREEAKAKLKSGAFDKILSPETKARLMGSLERRTVADAMREDDVRARMQSDVAAATVGGRADRTSAAEVESVAGPDAAAAYVREKKAADRLYGEVGPLHELSATDINARLASGRPDPNSPTFAEDTKIYGALQQHAAAELKRREDDPAGWAMSAGPGGVGSISDLLRGKYEAWANGPADQKPALFADYARATLARQTFAGVPPAQQRLFPVGVAGSLASDSKSSDGPTRKAALERMERILVQAGPAYAGRVNRELVTAGVAGRDLEAVASAAESRNPGFLASYANATLNPAAAKPLEGKAEKAVKEEVGRQTRQYLDSLAPLDPGLRQQANVQDAVLVEARSLVLERGLSPKAAVETAMKRYDRYAYRGRVRIPKALEGDAAWIGSGMEMIQKGVTAEDGKWLTEPPDPRTGKPMPGAAYAATVRKGGMWVTLPNDSGVVLMLITPAGPKPVLDDKGRRITRRWDELVKRGKTRGSSDSLKAGHGFRRN